MWDNGSDDTDEFPYLPANNHGQNTEIRPISEGSGHSRDSRRQRWGRSSFSPDEIQALESPLQDEPVALEDSQERDTPVFFANDGIKKNSENTEDRPRNLNNFQKVAKVVLLILPAIFFAAAAHFINGIMTDFKLFSASFSVFQGVFWPSFVFLVIDLVWWKKPADLESQRDAEKNCCCSAGKWKLAALLLLHGTLSGIAMIMQLLSIQRLNISVSLALSFSPEVYVILLSFINRERKFSLELILFSILTYTGFIIVGIPAMTSSSWKKAEGLTTGLVASLGSMTLAIPASFALQQLRRKNVPDSLIAVSFAFQGSLFSWITKVIMGSTMDMTFDPISFGWAASLIGLVLCGTLFLFIGSRFRRVWSSENDTSGATCTYSSISQMRMLIFIFSCFWEIVRQGMYHNFPGIYDIFGSLFVVLGYLLSVGFEAWTLTVSNEVKEESSPFQFISWMCTRTPVGNVLEIHDK